MIKENNKTKNIIIIKSIKPSISFREIRYLITSIDSFVFWVGNEWEIGGSEWLKKIITKKNHQLNNQNK
jgi:hypothetical protein